ncbi:hypothetical protein [Candidatus Lokiarchaeum ossiferum]|uniref:hypothetical protein n=1 Tax=Candidatus Lokiarchaeum ossiferum TaxID=2951803 RepID=UPI00352F0711
MDSYNQLPNVSLKEGNLMSDLFLKKKILTLIDALEYLHNLPYGYNSNDDKKTILFEEEKGTCTTKHAVAATLAQENGIDLQKHVGIYKMTEDIVAGTQLILDKYNLPFIPMVHCFLVHNGHRYDLTEGNHNGKKCSIEDFIFEQQTNPFISRKDEYLYFRDILTRIIMKSVEFQGKDISIVLKAREEAIDLLHKNVEP